MSTCLGEAESSSRCWDKEAKEGIEKVAQTEVERDVSLYEASMAHMDAPAARSARKQVKSELARVQNALVVAEEARCKVEI